jgi:beta-phosphoglucomutase-like phosphatase (HAD superfamily)
LRQLDVRTEEALAVEDSETGVSAAKSAGLRVIQVESPSDVNLGLLSSEFSTMY